MWDLIDFENQSLFNFKCELSAYLNHDDITMFSMWFCGLNDLCSLKIAQFYNIFVLYLKIINE